MLGCSFLSATPEAAAVAVHFQDMHVVVQQRSGGALRAEDPGPFVEGQVGVDQNGPALVALAEDLEERFRPGGGQGHEAQFVDDQQAEAGQLPLEVEQPPLIPGLQRSALPRFHRRYAPTGVLRQPGAAGPPGLPLGCGVRSAGPCQPQPAGMAGNSPVYGPGWEFPLVVAQGVAGKPS